MAFKQSLPGTVLPGECTLPGLHVTHMAIAPMVQLSGGAVRGAFFVIVYFTAFLLTVVRTGPQACEAQHDTADQ